MLACPDLTVDSISSLTTNFKFSAEFVEQDMMDIIYFDLHISRPPNLGAVNTSKTRPGYKSTSLLNVT